MIANRIAHRFLKAGLGIATIIVAAVVIPNLPIGRQTNEDSVSSKSDELVETFLLATFGPSRDRSKSNQLRRWEVDPSVVVVGKVTVETEEWITNDIDLVQSLIDRSLRVLEDPVDFRNTITFSFEEPSEYLRRERQIFGHNAELKAGDPSCRVAANLTESGEILQAIGLINADLGRAERRFCIARVLVEALGLLNAADTNKTNGVLGQGLSVVPMDDRVFSAQDKQVLSMLYDSSLHVGMSHQEARNAALWIISNQ